MVYDKSFFYNNPDDKIKIKNGLFETGPASGRDVYPLF
jgi:hypothetical protein